MATPRSDDGLLIPVIPIGMVATRAPCLLVGGGMVALRKAEWLQDCGATIEAVAPQFHGGFADLDLSRIRTRVGTYAPGTDLRPYLLVIAATHDEEVNQAVADDAARAGIPVNVVDDPPRCTFIVPATVARGALRVTVATGGGSPVLARCLRDELEQQFPAWYGDYVAALAVVRERLRAEGRGYDDRSRLIAELATPAQREHCAGLDKAAMIAHLSALAGLPTG